MTVRVGTVLRDNTGFWRVVSQDECILKSGPYKGRLKKGCRFGRGKYKGTFLKLDRSHSDLSETSSMTHPCASASPPSWCNRKRKRRSTNGLSSVTAAQVAAHFKKHKVKVSTKKACTVQSGKRKGKLKKGCFYGKGSLRGKILKKTR